MQGQSYSEGSRSGGTFIYCPANNEFQGIPKTDSTFLCAFKNRIRAFWSKEEDDFYDGEVDEEDIAVTRALGF